MALPTLSQISDRIARASAGGETLSVVVLRNVAIEPMEPFLRYEAARCGFSLELRFGEFDNIAQDATSQFGPIGEGTDLVVVSCFLEQVSPPLACRFPTLDNDARQLEIARVGEFVRFVVEAIRRRTSAAIVWSAFEIPTDPALGAGDLAQAAGQRRAIRDLNDRLLAIADQQPNVFVLDTEALQARLGADRYYDHRFWSTMRLPYSRDTLQALAADIFSFVRSVRGKQRKCLVLDCDGTLWGGVVGEVGVEGIVLADEGRGRWYADFQEEIVNLHARGVLLALASKNNPSDVWEVFANHRSMRLTKDHFVATRINWQDKATNLRSIAEELSIGLDSLVFADDSQFEIGLVAETLPMVECIQLEAERPETFRRTLMRSGFFDALSVTRQDRERSRSYLAEKNRKDLQQSTATVEEYLHSLGMVVEIRRATKADHSRLSQLSQRTNQFNLTTRRYTEADIAALAADRHTDVLAVSLTDRFGPYGTIGLSVVRYDAAVADIETLLLSCRALGRGVEDAVVNDILDRARKAGATTAVGRYVPSKKNQQVAAFYAAQGFIADPSAGEAGSRSWRTVVGDGLRAAPAFLTVQSDNQ
jgi:FkbH-like protein